MRNTVFRSLFAAVGLAALIGATPTPAAAGGEVAILVLKEHGVGSAAQAQPYVDKLVGVAAKVNGWSGAKGEYHTKRDKAAAFISSASPHYGILSLGAFLGLRGTHKLDVIGQASVAGAGGQQYFIISSKAGDLGGCKGKALASDHADDAKFIDKVVSGGAFKLSDFTLVETKRPLQTLKKVIEGEAECALIDDAQWEQAKGIEGGGSLKSVWQSAKLPPMAIVAFPSAPGGERDTFKSNLPKVCEGDGKAACREVGLQALKPAGAGDYASVVAAYSK
jgi:hypothetical protein